ncbi:MAG: hypothetical protein ALECFALPRED_000804 [Alectoria fallacina]|uniref:F-box domain-containing protein n=1 Tax=Alectoria fallacina TaxID=1903189 RepID=A0A8H3J9Z8_9LECA|nr:MAG: hypothetical protein ALECFALPRED_000804 [Alectoria fallacina]
MSQASLPGLAPELKIQIFKSMDSFGSVAVLSSTSRAFHDIWMSDTKSICDAVLQRIIECPIEIAAALVDAQESSQLAVHVPNLDTRQKDHSAHQSVIERTQRMLVNADTTLSIFKHFDYDVSFFSMLNPQAVLSTDQRHFFQAYYGGMTMVLCSHEGVPKSLIASWDMLKFQRVREILFFLTEISPEVVKQHLGINPVDSSEPPEEGTMAWKFKITVCRLERLEQVFLAVAPSSYLSRPLGMSCYYFLASYEQLAKTTERPGGALLAEVLPLLPEGALQRALNPDDDEFLP